MTMAFHKYMALFKQKSLQNSKLTYKFKKSLHGFKFQTHLTLSHFLDSFGYSQRLGLSGLLKGYFFFTVICHIYSFYSNMFITTVFCILGSWV